MADWFERHLQHQGHLEEGKVANPSGFFKNLNDASAMLHWWNDQDDGQATDAAVQIMAAQGEELAVWLDAVLPTLSRVATFHSVRLRQLAESHVGLAEDLSAAAEVLDLLSNKKWEIVR